MSKYKKNLMITTGVVTSVIISPILSAVAVGIGVPILLAYVYGVVPISLCRSGGCAVTTSSSGVKFELDDEESGIGMNVNNHGPGMCVYFVHFLLLLYCKLVGLITFYDNC